MTPLVRSVGLGASAAAIASTFVTPNHLIMSTQSARHGSTFVFNGGPAGLGAVIHMMIGAMCGTIFGALVALTQLRGVILIGPAACGAPWCS